MLNFIKNLFKKQPEKYCVDCKFRYATPLDFRCTNENVFFKEIDLVNGKCKSFMYCRTARKYENSIFSENSYCGKKAKYFEKKDL